jgi:hypothetical protein
VKSIPIALRNKLLNRIKAVSTDSEPIIKLIATQTSINTLLSEPIHNDIVPAFGDVTVQQTSGKSSPECAYAICLDNGIATVYRRKFPAHFDYKWEYEWSYGAADDVAIEYDGIWKMDPNYQWYYLETEVYPYVFTVEGGNLYVQKWKDQSSRTLLASDGINQISACKGWRNNIQLELDQGLIIGYLRNSKVYYRALCSDATGSLVWEIEREVSELGSGNSTLSIVRTNDYRVAFLTENNGRMKMALSRRNYAGMSVRPEIIHVHSKAKFLCIDKVAKDGYAPGETVRPEIVMPYFSYDTYPESPVVTVIANEKLNREDTFYSYGVKFYLDRFLFGEVDARTISGSSVSVFNGSSTTTVKISNIEYLSGEQALALYFVSDVKRTNVLTVTMPETRYLFYDRTQGQKWYVPQLSAEFGAESEEHSLYHPDEHLTAVAFAGFWIENPVFRAANNSWALSLEIAASVELIPISSLPI